MKTKHLRTSKVYSIEKATLFKKNLLKWAQEYQEVVWLDSNNHSSPYSSYDAILAVEAFTSMVTDHHDAFARLKEFTETTKDWLFGYLSYDLKNDTERLTSANEDGLEFPELYFFQPKKLWLLKGHKVEAHYLTMVADEMDSDFENILNLPAPATNFKQKLTTKATISNQLKIKLRTSKDAYFHKITSLLHHIHRGDIYEANMCQEFYAEGTLDALAAYNDLNSISEAPFACYVKLFDHYILSASPERYLKKEGNNILSQPIKGTSRRSENSIEDERLREELSKDPKEHSENVMIVDLVRNDLSKTALKGSVNVTELCKVYSFKQVYQLISTITSQVDLHMSAVEILRTTFPMGSMTGAPKVSAMKLIEDLEDAKRGVYSGSVGYFTPEGNFDFNVVIRSILYNAAKRYISYSVGGAITAKSNADKEYEECLIKAKAMRETLSNNII